MSASHAHSVLIVEDERIIAKDIQQTLQGMGYDAFAIASSAEEALERVAERCPDLVLMDIRIEGKKDGIEAARLLDELHHVPVIFLTAHTDEATLDRAKKVGPYAFLSKPVKPADLRGAIETSVYRLALDRQLRERERWFATTLNSVADAVVTTDLMGRVTFLNPAAEALLGIGTKSALGKPIEEVMRFAAPPLPGVSDKTPLNATLRLAKPMRVDNAWLVNLSTGTQSSISDSSSPVIVDGKMAGAVMVFHDDTEKRNIARQLVISDRLAALGTMAAGTAHELNNPLAIITSRVENAMATLNALPEDDGEPLRSMRRALEDIGIAAERMGRIIAELRTLSRPLDSSPRAIDPAVCIDWAVRATAHEFHNRARVEQRLGATPPVLADEARLGQVLVNLLVNAAHAIAPGGLAHNEVIITTRTDDKGRVVISVRDTGQGMTPEVLKRIFDPFFTTKDVGAGTGLGLAISHGIVSSLGGELRADSTPGAGSTFEILLPPANAAPTMAAATEAERTEPTSAVHRGRILVVDDEEVLLRAIKEILELDGLEVIAIRDARDALAMLARGEHFDVILSDMSMPNMTGIEFHVALNAQDERLAQRVIFMSGGAVTPQAAEFLRGLKERYIAKPFKGAELRKAVQKALASG
jgi:two-component system cell cycle sensor histidine kinase/response regulator CckA